jgi:hypothetical protein
VLHSLWFLHSLATLCKCSFIQWPQIALFWGNHPFSASTWTHSVINYIKSFFHSTSKAVIGSSLTLLITSSFFTFIIFSFLCLFLY